MDLYQVASLLITLAALFNYANYKWLKLPTTIGIMAMALVLSLIVLAIGQVFPIVEQTAEALLAEVDFSKALMNGMLGLLLFAGALHVDLGSLTAQKGAIALLATVGVLVSTFIVGGAMFFVLPLLGLHLSLIHCLLFGALIAPTDPIAVLGVLKTLAAPKSLETKIAGESLFNDGVGVVVFLALLGVAGLNPHHTGEFTASTVVVTFVQEAFGGAAFGGMIGWLAYLLLKNADDYQVEILISLATVMGGYALAQALHLSGAIAMVVAGILLGNQGRAFAMSERTRRHLDTFWELVDEILNAVLFSLIGFEMLVLNLDPTYVIAGALAVPITLIARLISVGIPMQLIPRVRRTPHAVKVLTWGGLRGGISVALALWLGGLLGQEHRMQRDLLLVMTYVVVVFSIVVQGLTVGTLIKKLGLREDGREGEDGGDSDEAPAHDPFPAPDG